MAGQVKDREAFQRLSFLYQAAHCVLAQDPENQALARFYCHTERTVARRLVLRRDPSVKRTLCRGCSSLLIPGLTCTQRQRHPRTDGRGREAASVASRAQTRCPDPEADPRPFVPEPPDLTRERGCKGQRWTVQTCLTCQRSQRFLNDPAHVLWGDLPEAQLGSQSDPKPLQPLPSTARPTPPHLTEEKVQPQSSRHQ